MKLIAHVRAKQILVIIIIIRLLSLFSKNSFYENQKDYMSPHELKVCSFLKTSGVMFL